MFKAICCQFTSPEMATALLLSKLKLRKSKYSSDETFHQNVRVPGPVTAVCRTVCWLSEICPLWAAAMPSCVTEISVSQGAFVGPVVQVRFVAFKAAARVRLYGMINCAIRLVTAPRRLVTMT